MQLMQIMQGLQVSIAFRLLKRLVANVVVDALRQTIDSSQLPFGC